jgi:Flp pilus assembly protein TadD
MLFASLVSVLIFVRTDCPISNRYAPELQRLNREFGSRGVTFWIVYPDPGETEETARKHVNEFGLPGTVLLDPTHQWVKRAGARTTPEAAVFTSDQRLIYHGRIDDRYVAFGKARSAPTTHDLQDAITAALEGKRVPRPTAPAIGCAISDLPTASAKPITFNKHIAPLMFSRCAPCHRPGESAPFSLLTYSDAKKHASQIAKVTRSRFMPPWLPETLPEPGPKFEGERRLTEAEIAIIQDWTEQGAIEGDPADLPPAPKFTAGWQLGEPDLIVKMPQPYTLQPGGPDVFRNFVLPVSVPETRFVKAVEIRPGNQRVVHHANVLVDRARSSRALEGKDGQPGFAGMDINIESNVFDPDGHFLFWKPGTVPFVEAGDMSWRLDQDTDLVLNMHLQPSGKPEPMTAMVGLYFTDKPPQRFPMLLQLEHDGDLNIPAGQKDFVITDQLKLPVDVDVLGIYPHAHYLGKDLLALATLPNGEKKTLIHIKHWDLNWQAVYRYEHPVSLPKGSVVSMRYTYDNSEDNVANPNRPPKRVKGGNLATDEMSHLWLQVVPPGKEDSRMVLQEALVRHTLGKYPGDFSAHYNLGAFLQLREQPAEAESEFRAALAAKPDNITVLNSLGASLQAQGKLDEAGLYLERAVQLRPDYVDAHYNLGSLRLAQGRPGEAVDHFRTVLKLKPEDAAGRAHLADALHESGNSLYAQGKLEEAIVSFRELIQIRPDEAGIHNDLGVLFARKGDIGRAVTQFEEAVRLNPRDTSARNNLEHARSKLSSQQ